MLCHLVILYQFCYADNYNKLLLYLYSLIINNYNIIFFSKLDYFDVSIPYPVLVDAQNIQFLYKQDTNIN